MTEPMTDERLTFWYQQVREIASENFSTWVPSSALYECADEIRQLREDNKRLVDSHRYFHDDVVAAMRILDISIHARPESDHVVFLKEVLPKIAKLRKVVEAARRVPPARMRADEVIINDLYEALRELDEEKP